MTTYIDNPLMGLAWDTVADSANSDQHIVPMNDDRKHDLHSKCWCNPMETWNCSWLHNDADGRTAYQLKWRKLN